MGINPRSFIRPTLLWLPVIVLILVVSLANGQTGYGGSAQEEFATVTTASASKAATTRVPVFTDYRGVRIGMTAEEVRSKLDELKKGDGQDFLVFSDRESAQIYYDDQGRVTAVSIDYFGENNNAPSPDVVLGAALEAKADGSMYQLNRYPEAGYWVSYNRTAGDKPIVTITMQKM
ncbi:MAG TPA: hypothetical protein VFY67_11900 [Pyrinomonadaceae bacterium]|nr:hypothetical protein [Pyrinomonadaceae bacterium]